MNIHIIININTKVTKITIVDLINYKLYILMLERVYPIRIKINK